MFVMNTVFNMAETSLVSALIQFYHSKAETKQDREDSGLQYRGKFLSYSDIFKVRKINASQYQNQFKNQYQDIRAAIDDIHVGSLKLKTTCLADPEKYIKKDCRLATLLERLQSEEKKTFLLTNSDWWFTNQIMTHLLGPSWFSSFSLVVVDACKPRFFSGQAEMRPVTTEQSSVPVYSGGDEVTSINLSEGWKHFSAIVDI